MSLRFLGLFLLLLAAVATPAQEVPAPPAPALPVKLDLSRRNLKNFLVDEDAQAPYRRKGQVLAELRDVFTIGSVKAPCALIWDPLACRLLGILRLEPGQADPVAPEYLFLASGPFPFSKTPGASGDPRYFGFRIVAGCPEFLYTCGSVSFEERLWLEEGGTVLKQRFRVNDLKQDLHFSVPEGWKDRVATSVGTWKGSVLTVPKDSSEEILLTYPLIPPTGPAATVDPKSD